MTLNEVLRMNLMKKYTKKIKISYNLNQLCVCSFKGWDLLERSGRSTESPHSGTAGNEDECECYLQIQESL